MANFVAGSITFCGDPLGSPCKKRTIGGLVMSEVNRYQGNLYYQGFGPVKTMADVVMASDYDASQSELAALREELSKVTGERDRLRNGVESDMAEIDRIQSMYDGEIRKCAELRKRLTAAEQRNAELTGLLRMAYLDENVTDARCARIEVLISEPTESGASE